MNQTLTARQLAAQFDNAAAEVTEAVGAVVRAAAYRVRGNAHDSVAAGGEGGDNDSYAFAARQIEAVPDGELEMVVGYDNRIAPLAAAIEFGTATGGPGGQLSRALMTEAPIFERVVPLAALKRLR